MNTSTSPQYDFDIVRDEGSIAEFHEACRSGNDNYIQEQLQKDPCLATTIAYECTYPIKLRLSPDLPHNIDTVAMLLDACPSAAFEQGDDGFTAWDLCRDSSWMIQEMFLEAHFIENDRKNHFRPLHSALTNSSLFYRTLFMALENNRENIQVQDEEGNLPLHLALQHYNHGYKEQISMIFRAFPSGAKVQNGLGKYPLQVALESRCIFYKIDLFPALIAEAPEETPPFLLLAMRDEFRWPDNNHNFFSLLYTMLRSNPLQLSVVEVVQTETTQLESKRSAVDFDMETRASKRARK
mmetsp:Transcript_24524/g.37308  ORF Transcript_24524/g.37308 Transcript_24524/m.37308 type:complete len:296 (+) Transcript_24524:336-1223(+)